MSAPARKRWLIVLRRHPVGNALAREALDVALAGAVFEQPIDVLFTSAGVWQLFDDDAVTAIGRRGCARTIASFPLYGLDAIHVDGDSLREQGLDASQIEVPHQISGRERIRQLLEGADVVLNF